MATKWTIPTASKTGVTASTEVPDYFGTNSGGAFETARAAKIPGLDPMIYQAALSADGLASTLNKGVADYNDALQKVFPTLARANKQETASVNSVFDPNGIQATLQGIRERQTKAMDGVDSILRADISKGLGLGRVGASGTAGGGLSSFLTKIAAAEAGKLRLQNAASVAAGERADANTLLSARTSAAGQRQALATSLLSLLNQPGEVSSNAQSKLATALSNILQLSLGNSFTGLATAD